MKQGGRQSIWGIMPLLALMGTVSAAVSFQIGPILHQRPSVAPAQEPLTLEAIVEIVDGEIQSGNIYYRAGGQISFIESPMSTVDGSLYFGTVPASDIISGELEYYLAFVLADGAVLMYPEVEPTLNPVIIPIMAGQAQEADAATQFAAEDVTATESDILILAPDEGNAYLPENVVVAVSLFNVPDVDVTSVQLLLDGQDVTGQTDVSIDIVAYTPPELSTGLHQLELRVANLAGAYMRPLKWSFRVTREATASSELAFKQSGRTTIGTRRDDIEGTVLSVNTARINYRAGWNWLKIRSSIKLSSNEDPFKPARNRFKVKFETPIIALGLGDVTPRTNRFALDGKRIRGYMFDLDARYAKLKWVQGELDRVNQSRLPSAYDVTDYIQTADGFGNTSYDVALTRKNYGFRRDVFALRASLGSGKVFELAFNYLKAKDNIASVDSIRAGGTVAITDSTFIANFFQDAPFDTSLQAAIITFQELQDKALTNSDLNYILPEDDWEGANPKDNIVFGSDISLALDNRRMVFQSGFAFSMLNNNIWDPVLSKEELDTFAPGDTTVNDSILDLIALDDLPIDPGDLEDIFHINLNMVPLLPINPSLLADGKILDAVLRMPSMAYHASAKFNYLRNFITLDYQQVGPEFNSLGNPNLQKNVRIRTISDRIRMFRNKLFITASYRATDDDIVKVEGDNITTTGTSSLTASLNLGVGLPGVSFGLRSVTRANGISILDTILTPSSADPYYFRDRRENTLNKTTNIGLTYRLHALSTAHNLSLTLNNTSITDQINTDRDADSLFISPIAISKITAISILSTISPQLRTNLTFSTNTSEFGEGDRMIAQDLVMMGLTAKYRINAGKIIIRGGLKRISAETNRSKNEVRPPSFVRMSIEGGVELRLVENLRFVGSFEMRSRKLLDTGQTQPSSIVAASLNYTF